MSKRKDVALWPVEDRKEYIETIQKFTLFDDTFLNATFENIKACQHIIEVITGIPGISVVSSKTQYSLSGVATRGVRLDVFARDATGKLYNIEVQQADSVDHPRRIRYYTSVIDSSFLMKGADFDQLPNLVNIYISRTDIWECGKTIYRVRKSLDDTGLDYDDGQQTIYVNAEADDGSAVAKLMNYFKTADPDDDSQGELSKYVHFLKSEQGGHDIMCEIAKKIYNDGINIGIDGMRLTAFRNAIQKGLPEKDAAEIAEIPPEEIEKYLERLKEVKPKST